MEVVLTAYFFYAQPLCEPCIDNSPCPPCISDEQIITLWAGGLIAFATIGFFTIYKTSEKRKWLVTCGFMK